MAKFFDDIAAKFRTAKWKNIFDKITTGLLIAMILSPIFILGYILLWFIFR
ncbi:MAG: hypothetical protein IJX92_03130 [Clostridia bacterium]|nr:hypothetical protein [Clostridia bacterium]